ncbi:UNKNOWN [Stylonychia lemnae]|uniref:Transmembrane protein n=1 Tax=Stylonychia lemnae TaxID=5949 RepID=A0A078A3X0_STYLE|nr:UNKNOWN [Stylonychia lemnae]|eukprot:CDW75454.1 UNKNOWN [Stylonychia lemnae]
MQEALKICLLILILEMIDISRGSVCHSSLPQIYQNNESERRLIYTAFNNELGNGYFFSLTKENYLVLFIVSEHGKYGFDMMIKNWTSQDVYNVVITQILSSQQCTYFGGHSLNAITYNTVDFRYQFSVKIDVDGTYAESEISPIYARICTEQVYFMIVQNGITYFASAQPNFSIPSSLKNLTQDQLKLQDLSTSERQEEAPPQMRGKYQLNQLMNLQQNQSYMPAIQSQDNRNFEIFDCTVRFFKDEGTEKLG